jgi:hypothetical protein
VIMGCCNYAICLFGVYVLCKAYVCGTVNGPSVDVIGPPSYCSKEDRILGSNSDYRDVE